MGSYPKSQKTLSARNLAILRDKTKPLYHHYTVPMASRLGRMGTCTEGLISMKSYKALITWSC